MLENWNPYKAYENHGYFWWSKCLKSMLMFSKNPRKMMSDLQIFLLMGHKTPY
jgi:hypothetical protein